MSSATAWWLLGAALAIAGLAIASRAVVVLERRFRAQVWRENEADVRLWRMILYSDSLSIGDPWNPDHRLPHRPMAFRMYGYEAQPLIAADLGSNNLGFMSTRDYRYERGPNEFRIVVIGGEQTASSVVDCSWPDMLEDELNRRDPSARYRVINIGWPDAGPEHYIKAWEKEGAKFSPDLVIVNYVETDFYRPLVGRPLAYRGRPVGHTNVSYRVGTGPDDVAVQNTAIVRGHRAASYRHPLTIPGRPYSFKASPPFVMDERRVRALQVQVVRDMVAGALPPFGVLALRRLAGGQAAAVDVHELRNFDPQPDQPLDRERMIEFGIASFGWLTDHVPNLILTHNFHYYELNQRFEFTEEMVRRAPRIRVVDMRQRVPAGVSDDELRSWYQIPHMAEKWSDRGHAAYAGLMAGVVSEWRAAQRDRAGTSVAASRRPV